MATSMQQGYTSHRFAMNVLLSLLATVSMSTQDMNKIVSAEVKASSAPVAIAELSKQVGFPLEAIASTKEDFLIIKVKDVPLGVLLQKIAATTNTEWEQTANGYRLTRTDPIRRKEAAEEQEKLAQLIQTSFDKYRKTSVEEKEVTDRSAQQVAERLMTMMEMQQSGQPGIDWREQQKLNSQGPAYRMMRKISVMLDAKTLATIPEGQNVVMSNMPNRMQKPLPGNIQPYVQAFIKEQTIWAKAMKMARDRRAGQQHYYYENLVDPSQRKIGKILLIMNRSQQMRGIQARLVITDDKGRPIGQAQDNFGWDYESYSSKMAEIQKTAANESEFKFTGTSKALQDALQEAYKSAEANRGQPDIQVSDDLKQVLLNPEKNEPLSFVATDCVFETARIKDMDIVCAAPDMMMLGVGPVSTGGVKPSFFLAALSSYSMETEVKDNWITLKPQVPSAARRARTDRVVLGQYLRQAMKEGRVSLDNRASYAFRSGKTEEEYMPMFLLSMIGLLKSGMEYGGDWDTLRLYGSLTPPQRQAAKTGQPIPFRSLQAPQWEILRHVVFDSPYPRLQVNYQQEDFAEAQNEDGVIYGGGLDQEPTEVLPTGFTGAETLTIRETMEPKFFSKPDNNGDNRFYYGESAFDLQGLAFQLFQYERPELFPWLSQPGYSSGKISKVRLGTQRQIIFEATFTRRASLNLQLTDKNYEGEAVSVDRLPAATKKQLEEALAKIREQHKNSKPPNWNPGGGGGTLPPPPPR